MAPVLGTQPYWWRPCLCLYTSRLLWLLNNGDYRSELLESPVCCIHTSGTWPSAIIWWVRMNSSKNAKHKGRFFEKMCLSAFKMLHLILILLLFRHTYFVCNTMDSGQDFIWKHWVSFSLHSSTFKKLLENVSLIDFLKSFYF